jgi:membrane protein implicated in regulation of membrane protease activity
MNTALWIWLALAVLFVIMEIFTPGFIFACFVAGAVASGITSLFTENYLVQGIVFAVVSLILIPLTRPLVAKITKPSPVASNMDAFLGRVGYVKNQVSSIGGQVMVDDQVWQARSDKDIAVGKKVVIRAVEGTKVIVDEIS